MVPPCSDRISRVPPYSSPLISPSHTGLSPILPEFPIRSANSIKGTGLLRVRSPLLAESRLMSFPPGTEMFQFPGFASAAYVFSYGSPCGGVSPFGRPWIKACSQLPMAYRSVPRPSSPPGAKASTECPFVVQFSSPHARALNTLSRATHHKQEPSIRSSLHPPSISFAARNSKPNQLHRMNQIPNSV